MADLDPSLVSLPLHDPVDDVDRNSEFSGDARLALTFREGPDHVDRLPIERSISGTMRIQKTTFDGSRLVLSRRHDIEVCEGVVQLVTVQMIDLQPVGNRTSIAHPYEPMNEDPEPADSDAGVWTLGSFGRVNEFGLRFFPTPELPPSKESPSENGAVFPYPQTTSGDESPDIFEIRCSCHGAAYSRKAMDCHERS